MMKNKFSGKLHLMSIIFIACLLINSLVVTSATVGSDFPPAREALECTTRGGLPHFFRKISKGEKIRIAYLGGSITAQAGWRVKSLDYFKKSYPKCQFSEINAAIGGTGSDLGVLRIQHDVLSQKPDLLFVEFAVNDSNSDPVEIAKSMEGIVRKTWKAYPKCDICFVYTFTDSPLFQDLKTGKLNRSAATMEVIADYYAIPSIHLGLEAVHLEKEGKLIMKAPEVKVEKVSGDELNQSYKLPLSAEGKIHFSSDGVHPYINTGHQLYMEAIERSLPLIRSASKKSRSHQLNGPFNPNNYENTIMLDPDKANLQGEWMKLPQENEVAKPFINRVSSFWRGAAGATLTLKFKGEAVKIYDLLGPDGCRLEITIDGKISNVNRIDGYCTYRRLAITNAAFKEDQTKIHELKIKILPEKLDKRNILFEQNRADFDKNPKKYEDNYWYVGAIFVAGELIQ